MAAQAAADRAMAVVLVQAAGLEQLDAEDKKQQALKPELDRAREALQVAKPVDKPAATKQLAEVEARWDAFTTARRAIRSQVESEVARIRKLPDRCFVKPPPADCRLPAAVTRELSPQ